MKRIAVVAIHREYAAYLRQNLEPYLKRRVEIQEYSVDDVEGLQVIPADYVVVSAFTIFQRLKWKIRGDAELIIVYITLDKERLPQLGGLPDGTRAYLVNIDYRTCMQVITQVYEAGYRNLDLLAWYGEGEPDPSIRIAITPNELELVPPGIEQVINIGERVLDAGCILDIADRVGVHDVFGTVSATQARSRAFAGSPPMERLLGENESLSGQIHTLLGLMDQGIIITDMSGRICLCNGRARQLLRSRSDILEGFSLSEVLPEIDVFLVHDTTREDLVCIGGNDLVIGGTQIKVGDEIRGGIFTVAEFQKMEEKQHHMRSRLSGGAHGAFHRFADIIGDSGEIRDMVATARRMAKSDSSVMITGESGTGKEVFAQSIHNASRRAQYNFVAVNCAAIPETLLESEMFGYEEGAFTGARRGGKTGYFELAHNGTIFLDEIGEMPLLLQSKLLRVIEEKRIVKVGSHKLIDVDVRIVAATNKDILRLVEEGSFREDLYYRLNVLPLHLPGLRERRGDIPLLAEHFMRLTGARFTFDEAAMTQLMDYAWRGNIRELRNMVEYFENLGKAVIEPADILFLTRHAPAPRRPATESAPEMGGSESIARFLIREESRLGIARFVLGEIEGAYRQHRRIGRSTLEQIAREQGVFYSEQEIRTCMEKLSEGGFILSRRGRGGSRITKEGADLLRQIRQR